MRLFSISLVLLFAGLSQGQCSLASIRAGTCGLFGGAGRMVFARQSHGMSHSSGHSSHDMAGHHLQSSYGRPVMGSHDSDGLVIASVASHWTPVGGSSHHSHASSYSDCYLANVPVRRNVWRTRNVMVPVLPGEAPRYQQQRYLTSVVSWEQRLVRRSHSAGGHASAAMPSMGMSGGG